MPNIRLPTTRHEVRADTTDRLDPAQIGAGLTAPDDASGQRPDMRPAGTARSRATRIRRGVLLLVVVAALWLATSLGQAVTAPGTDPVAARLAEWARFHHLGAVVTISERVQYALNAPKTGGLPSRPVPRVAPTAPAPMPALPGPPEPGNSSAVPLRPGPKAPLRLRAVPGLAGEGQWQTLMSVAGQPAVQAAFLRPDAVHTSYFTGVAMMDQNLLRMEYHPGSQVPGGKGWGVPTSILPGQRDGLVATFNGGFTLQDSRGGVWDQGRTAGALRDGAAALVIDPAGHADVVQWGRDRQLGSQTTVVRQNLDLLVDGGQLAAGLNSNDNPKWGRTIGHRTYVWRSAIGVTQDGALVYVAGGALTTLSLAEMEKDAGAVRAMELDINPAWTSFMTYQHPAAGVAVPVKLTADQQPAATRYLTTSTRDFFALYSRR